MIRRHCHECKSEDGLTLLVKSAVINPVYACMDCKRKLYPWLRNGLISKNDWINKTMKPKELTEFSEGGDGGKSRKTHSKKCSKTGEPHDFVLVKPAHVGTYGSAIQRMTLREAYESDIEASTTKSWLKNRVFVYFRCADCDRKKFDILKVEDARNLIKDL